MKVSFTMLKTKGRKAKYCQGQFRTLVWFWLFTQQDIKSINTQGENVDSQLTELTPCKWSMKHAYEMSHAYMDACMILDRQKCYFEGLCSVFWFCLVHVAKQATPFLSIPSFQAAFICCTVLNSANIILFSKRFVSKYLCINNPVKFESVRVTSKFLFLDGKEVLFKENVI